MDQQTYKNQIASQLAQYQSQLKHLKPTDVEQRRSLQKSIFDTQNILDLIQLNKMQGRDFSLDKTTTASGESKLRRARE